MAKQTKRREWRRPDDGTDSFPAITDEPATDGEVAKGVNAPAKREVPAWVKRFGDAVVVRLPHIIAAVLGGLLL